MTAKINNIIKNYDVKYLELQGIIETKEKPDNIAIANTFTYMI
jgi:hypothetical protein